MATPSHLLREQFNYLRAKMGVYGNWIILYGKQLDKRDILVQDIMAAYTSYQEMNRFNDILGEEAMLRLFVRIDEFCRIRKHQTPQELGFPDAETLHPVYKFEMTIEDDYEEYNG